MQISSYVPALRWVWSAAAKAALGAVSGWRRAGERSSEERGGSRRRAAVWAAVAVGVVVVASPKDAEAQETTRYATAAASDVAEGESLVITVTIQEGSIPGGTGPSVSTITYSYSIASSNTNVVTSTCTDASPCNLDFLSTNTEGTLDIALPTTRDISSETNTVVTVTLNQVTAGHYVGTSGSTDTSGDFTANVLNVPTVTVALAPASVVEREDLTLTFTPSAAVKRATDLTYDLSTAACPSPNAGLNRALAQDFSTATTFPGTVSYAVDEDATKTETLETIRNSDLPGHEAECVAIEVTNPSGSGVALDGVDANGRVYAVIRELPQARVYVPAGMETVTEGGLAEFTIARSGVTTGPLTVNYTLAQTGTVLPSGTQMSGSVDFAGTDPMVVVMVPTHDDQVDEADGSVTLTLESSSSYLLPPVFSDTVNVRDNDTPAISVAAVNANGQVSEGETLTFRVTVDPVSVADIVLDYTLDGTGIADTDFLDSRTGDDLTIMAGTASADIAVRVADDGMDELSETVELSLTLDSTSGEATLPAAPQAAATITGDTPTVSIGDAPAVDEGGTLQFPVTVSPQYSQPFTITLALSTGTGGIEDSDFDPDPPVLTLPIAANASSATFMLPTADDDVDEPNEEVTVSFTLPAGLTDVVTGTGIATGIIRDLDVPALSFTVAQANEGQALTVTAAVNPPSHQDIIVEYALDSTSEATEDDFAQSFPGTWTIPQGRSTQSFSLLTASDNLAEVSEDVVLAISIVAPSGRDATIGSPTATGTIHDLLESTLSAPLREGASAALRNHVDRFQRLSSSIAMSRLEGERARELRASGVDGLDQFSFTSGFSEAVSNTAAWGAMSYGGIAGDVEGSVVDAYAGYDVLGLAGNHVLGWMVGYEDVDAEVREVDYNGEHLQAGAYGALRVGEDMIVDGAITWGTGQSKAKTDTVRAKSRSQRLVMRADLTGGYEWQFAGISMVSQVGALFARQNLKAFTDSVGATGSSQRVSAGRLQAGALMRWTIRGVEFTGNPRLYWDNHRFGEERERDLAMSFGASARIDAASVGEFNVHGAVDGFGIASHYRSYRLGIVYRWNF